MRSASEMTGENFGNPGPAASSGVRATPNFVPAPNSEPLGAITGAPPRTRLYSRMVATQASVGVNGGEATQVVTGTANNRLAILTAPLVGWSIYIGDSGVTPDTGLQLTPGLAYEVILPGLQELYAVTDAPVPIALQVQVASVLMAERERRL